MRKRQAANILDNKVVKTGQPLLMAIETEKTRRAHEIGEASGLFTVPRVITFEPTAGRLELELLTRIRPLRLVLNGFADWKKLIARIGQSLAVIHDQIHLPATLAVALPEAWQLAGAERVVLHGDFGISNIQFDERENRLVILDWSVMPWLGSDGTIGPREFDIAWFVWSLFFVRRRCGFLSKRAAQEAAIFLENYFAQTEYSQDIDVFLRYLRNAEGRFLQTWLASVSMTYLRRVDYLLHARRCKKYARSSGLRRKCESIFKN